MDLAHEETLEQALRRLVYKHYVNGTPTNNLVKRPRIPVELGKGEKRSFPIYDGAYILTVEFCNPHVKVEIGDPENRLKYAGCIAIYNIPQILIIPWEKDCRFGLLATENGHGKAKISVQWLDVSAGEG